MAFEYPSSDGVLIPGKRGNLFGHYYLPGGPYPRPVVLIAHGIPGNERLFDFSIYLREHGFCTVNFHYSGCWGSEGDYSIPHCFEDIGSAVEYIRRNENGWFDLDNFFFVGHSMGGLMGAYAISSYEAIRAGVLLAPFNLRIAAEPVLKGEHGSFWDELFSTEAGDTWLKNFSREAFVRYVSEDPDRYDLLSYAEGLSKKNVFVVTCSRDIVCPKDVHGGALAEAIAKAGGVVQHTTYDSDHSFNTRRGEIRQDVTKFLLDQVK